MINTDFSIVETQTRLQQQSKRPSENSCEDDKFDRFIKSPESLEAKPNLEIPLKDGLIWQNKVAENVPSLLLIPSAVNLQEIPAQSMVGDEVAQVIGSVLEINQIEASQEFTGVNIVQNLSPIIEQTDQKLQEILPDVVQIPNIIISTSCPKQGQEIKQEPTLKEEGKQKELVEPSELLIAPISALTLFQVQNNQATPVKKQEALSKVTLDYSSEEEQPQFVYSTNIQISPEHKTPNSRILEQNQQLENIEIKEEAEQIELSDFASSLKSDIQKIEQRSIVVVKFEENQAKAIADQINIQIEKAVKTGDSEIKISLNPESLGKVDVKINISDNGTYDFEIKVEKKETLEILQQEIKSLENSIKEVTKSENSTFNFNLKDGNGQQGQQRQHERFEILSEFMDDKKTEVYVANYAYGHLNKAAHAGGVDITI